MNQSDPFHVHLYDSVADIPPEVWHETKGDSLIDCYHGPGFLQPQETAFRNNGFRFHYGVIRHNNMVSGLAVFQVKVFTLRDMIGDVLFLRSAVGRLLNRPLAKVIICGDLISSDISGMVFRSGYTEAMRANMLGLAAQQVIQRHARHMGILLLKDVPADSLCRETVIKAGFQDIDLSPTMYIPISDSWRDLQDYKNVLKSKYRTFLNSVQADAQDLSVRKLQQRELIQYQKEIDELYAMVYNRSKHKGPYLGFEYFAMLNSLLGHSHYDVLGYFARDRLVAFNTRFYSDRMVDSTFFGMRQEDNIKYQLLRNMILDDLTFAIKTGAKTLHLGRTNYQMKSSMGALTSDSHSFIKPLNRISKPLVSLAGYFARPETWVQCNPYAES